MTVAPKAGASARVLVIGTGGTIAMVGANPYDWVEYGDRGGAIRAVAEVIADLSPLLPNVDLELISFRLIGSAGIQWNDWVELARLVRELTARQDADGIVITHGTASMEETAWFLDLLVESSMAVVLVGAQRPPNTYGSDAAPNLRAAVAVAASRDAKGLGVLVVMNNQVFGARDVRKAANFSLDAFEAPEFGPLGRIEASGHVVFRRCPSTHRNQTAAQFLPALNLARPPRVDIAMSYAGADGTAIRAFQQAGAEAIISLGMPPGRCTPAERAALREAVAAGTLVVQTSRVARGAVVAQKYNTDDGIYSGGDLAANKLRILLMLALGAGLSREEIERLLNEA